MTTPAEQLEAEVSKPASVSNDGVTVTRRSLSELIEYEKHLANKEAMAAPVGSLKAMITRIVPPGGH
jgi:hypothetical protein